MTPVEAARAVSEQAYEEWRLVPDGSPQEIALYAVARAFSRFAEHLQDQENDQ